MLGTYLKITLGPIPKSNFYRNRSDLVGVRFNLNWDRLDLARIWSNLDWDRLGNCGQMGMKFELGLRSGEYLSNDTLPLGGKPRMTIVTAVKAAVNATGKIISSIMWWSLVLDSSKLQSSRDNFYSFMGKKRFLDKWVVTELVRFLRMVEYYKYWKYRGANWVSNWLYFTTNLYYYHISVRHLGNFWRFECDYMLIVD